MYQMFKINLKNWDNNMRNWLITCQIEYRITFKIKAGYYFELLTSETMKLLESTEKKISKDKNGKNAPQLQITEVI